jgi:hypothetical protein
VKFCKTTLIIICVIFTSTLGAQDLLGTKAQTFLTGVLVQTENGQKSLVTANILARHEWISGSFSQKHGTVVSKILWAGEIEVKDGAVTRINETAGVIIGNRELTKGLDVQGAGIKNLKLFLDENNAIKDRYFKNTEFITYDPNNEDLDSRLNDVEAVRHNVRNWISAVISFLEMSETRPGKKEELYSTIKIASQKIIKTYYNAITLVPELDIKEWKRVKFYLQKIVEDKTDFSSSDLMRAYREFYPKTDSYMVYVSQHFSVAHVDTLSDYVGKKALTESDLVELIDKDRLGKFIDRAVTAKDIMTVESIMDNISLVELNSERFNSMSGLIESLEVQRVKVLMSSNYGVKKIDAESALCKYTGLSKGTDLSVLVMATLDKMEEEVGVNGKFSEYTLGNMAREDVLDLILQNVKIPQVVEFVGLFKDVLEVNKATYKTDYYKKPEFEKVRRGLFELKGLCKN